MNNETGDSEDSPGQEQVPTELLPAAPASAPQAAVPEADQPEAGQPEAGQPLTGQAQAPAPPGQNVSAPPSATVQERRPARTRLRITLVVLLLLLGFSATGAGGALVAKEMTRPASAAEVHAAGQQELATLWRRMTMGQIFPRTVTFTYGQQDQAIATRIGIAPQSSCGAAADPGIGEALHGSGCVTVLRATYTDQSRTLLVTVGIAVMTSSGGVQHLLDTTGAAQRKSGILAVSFPDVPFPDSVREVFGAQAGQGPYLFFYTAGFADGRSTGFDLADGEYATSELGIGLMDNLGKLFAAPAKPCASKDITC